MISYFHKRSFRPIPAVTVLLLLACAAGVSAQENKTALIIGNSAYENFSPLGNPVDEAGQMAAALERIGFKVILLKDATQDEMIEGLMNFEYELRNRKGLALFHYGGHGVQVGGCNYLIPVDADIPNERLIRSRAVDVDEFIGTMEIAGAETNIIILDACRNNPLPGQERSGTRGLAAVGNPPPNSIIVYSADAGATAQDGLFTPTLLKYIETPGMELNAILRNVRRDVLDATGGKQRTGEYDQLVTEVYLAGRRDNVDPIPAVPTGDFSGYVDVTNATGEDLYYLFVSHSESDSWGDDMLGDEILPDGETYRVFLSNQSSSIFDIQAKNEDGERFTYMGVDVETTDITVHPEDIDPDSIRNFIGEVTLNGPGGDFDGYVDVTNDTGFNGLSLYIKQDSKTWGPDLMGDENLPEGSSFKIYIRNYPHSVFDIRMTDEDGDTYSFFNIDIASEDVYITMENLD